MDKRIIETAKALCIKVVDKVESGRATSKETYAECKELLEKISVYETSVAPRSVLFRCPKCLSVHVGQYRMMTGPIWCEDCGYRVGAKEIENPFIVLNTP